MAGEPIRGGQSEGDIRILDLTRTPEIRVEMRLQNNRLYQLRTSAGLTRRALSLAAGIAPARYGALESMKLSPRGKRVTWLADALKLSAYWKCLPDDLFPEEIEAIEKTRASIEVSAGDMREVFANSADPALLDSSDPPDAAYFEKEMRTKVKNSMDRLTPRQERVIRLRFWLGGGEEHTIDEIAKLFGVGRDRIREIEGQALRNLRRPVAARRLAPFSAQGDIHLETESIRRARGK